MKQTYSIGGFPFEIISESTITVPEMFRKFEADTACPVYTYSIKLTDTLPTETDSVQARRPDLVVGTAAGGGETRLLGIKGRPDFYASYSEADAASAEILLDESKLTDLHIDPVFTSLLAMERHMMDLNQFVLHCAYVRYKGEAILFSAPSETGKTTQANLWEQYRQSRTINGDRALLSFSEGRLMANGWPVCGSSEICENESTPVRAIVMLSQGRENRIRRIGGREAFSLLYSQLTVNSWNSAFVNKSIDFIENMLTALPIYHLSCTISYEAVELLETALYAESGSSKPV